MWILVLWGRRQRERHRGYVADYCSVCRQVGPFEMIERRMAYHIWFIPVERGRLLGTSQICQGCQTEMKSFPEQFTAIARSARGPLEALIQKTFPTAREAYREQLAAAEAIATNAAGMDATTRHRLMMEVFGKAEPYFRSGYGHQGRRILVVALRPFATSEPEIRACLERFRETNCRMGAILRVEEVMVSLYPELEVKDPNRFSY